MNPLPFVLSLPHCSTAIAAEIVERLAVGDEEVARSADLCTGEIYVDLPVVAVVPAVCSRLVVDLNRAIDDQRPMGVIPQTDYGGNRVWKPGREPSAALRAQLIERYYQPFHTRLRNVLATTPCAGLIDCHSLEGIGPVNAPDRSQRRKDVTLGNLGDPQRSTSTRRATSCPGEILVFLAEAFRAEGFSVALNHPYSGGFITATYGPLLRRQGKWAIQVELNEDLYKQSDAYACDALKLSSIKMAMGEVLCRFADDLRCTDQKGGTP